MTAKVKKQNVRAGLASLGIAEMLSVLFSVCLLLTLAIVGAFSLRTIFASKYEDTIGLLFADAERIGYLVRQELATARDREQGRPDAILRLGSGKALQVLAGPWSEGLSLNDFHIDAAFFKSLPAKDTVLQFTGKRYLASALQLTENGDDSLLSSLPERDRTVGQYLVLWSIPADGFHVDKTVFEKQGTSVYILSREGQLLYTNDPSITEKNFIARPLVKTFIQSPLSQGYLATDNANGEHVYGAYYELPDSNIVIFAETQEAHALSGLNRTIRNAAVIFFTVLVLSLILIQFPLRQVTNPIRNLAKHAEEVARGNFNSHVEEKGQGELRLLTQSFNQMCHSLRDRDSKIRDLSRQELEKLALEGELAIAQKIQNNLLPPEPRLRLGDLSIKSTYIPASQCAGDWYNLHFEDGYTLFVIADVSGHGVGASMYTAMIAGIFDLFIRKPRSSWKLEDFASEVNSIIHRLGKRQWHATMLMGWYGHGEMELLSAGHTPPIISYPLETGLKTKLLTLSSDPLGLNENVNAKIVKLPFPKGAALVLYTDGLTEMENPAGKAFGNKKLAKIISKQMDPELYLDDILKNWTEFQEGELPKDDVCVVTLHAA